MSHIIGIGSIRPFGVDMVYVQVSELVNETIFNLERCLRGVVQKNPWAEWRHFMEPLTRDGFELIQPPQEHPIFIHSRPWDEHLVGYGQSFFVAFPETAPYELAGRLVLATPYASIYASVSADYTDKDQVVLVNAEYDPVYPDDLAWRTEEHEEKSEIGPVLLPRDQFVSDAEYLAAKSSLIKSGYSLIEPNC